MSDGTEKINLGSDGTAKINVGIHIDAETINQQITAAVAASAIGTELKKQIEEAIKSLTRYRDSPIRKVVEEQIQVMIRDIITNEYNERLRAAICEKLTDEVIDKVIDAAWYMVTRKLS